MRDLEGGRRVCARWVVDVRGLGDLEEGLKAALLLMRVRLGVWVEVGLCALVLDVVGLVVGDVLAVRVHPVLGERVFQNERLDAIDVYVLYVCVMIRRVAAVSPFYGSCV